MTIYWYDKQGKPLVTAEWNTPEWRKQMQAVEKLLCDTDYNRIGDNDTPGHRYRVSTVWLGLDHDMFRSTTLNPNPLIFETMVFRIEEGKQPESVDSDRYWREDQAIHGHDVMLKEWTEKEDDEI